MVHTIERKFAGRKLRIETGRLARQAAGAALVQFGDTAIVAAVVVPPSAGDWMWTISPSNVTLTFA
ncbi:MAG: hypothetical protein ACREKI_09880 [Gemmatimonadota bacterium]